MTTKIRKKNGTTRKSPTELSPAKKIPGYKSQKNLEKQLRRIAQKYDGKLFNPIVLPGPYDIPDR